MILGEKRYILTIRDLNLLLLFSFCLPPFFPRNCEEEEEEEGKLGKASSTSK